MLSIPQTSLKADRFRSYVEELRQFASTYGMRCGEPGDLRGFAAGLDGNADFRDECGSMLRAIVYRERGKAPPSELLALVAAAWGGSDVENAAEGLQETIRAILRFASGVMNTSREGARRSGDPVSTVAAETAPPAGAVVTETALIVAVDARIETIDAGTIAEDEEPLSPLEKVQLAITALERESGDVIRYVELLRQRANMEQMRRDAVVAQALPYLALRTKLLSQPQADASDLNEAAAPVPYDPWREDSDLQKELRRFAAERDVKRAAERMVKEDRSLQARFLRRTESMVRHVVGVDNFLRRSLDRRSL